jgi:hypothetical protein
MTGRNGRRYNAHFPVLESRIELDAGTDGDKPLEGDECGRAGGRKRTCQMIRPRLTNMRGRCGLARQCAPGADISLRDDLDRPADAKTIRGFVEVRIWDVQIVSSNPSSNVPDSSPIFIRPPGIDRTILILIHHSLHEEILHWLFVRAFQSEVSIQFQTL